MFLMSRERRCLSSPQIQLITAQTTAACRTWWTVSGIIARCYCELWNHISNACLLLSAQEVRWATPRDTKSSATSGSALGLMLPSAPCCKRRPDPASSKCCLWEMFALNSVFFSINRLNWTVFSKMSAEDIIIVFITHKFSRMDLHESFNWLINSESMIFIALSCWEFWFLFVSCFILKLLLVLCRA